MTAVTPRPGATVQAQGDRFTFTGPSADWPAGAWSKDGTDVLIPADRTDGQILTTLHTLQAADGGRVEFVARAIIRSDFRGEHYREPLHWRVAEGKARAAIAAVEQWDAKHPVAACGCGQPGCTGWGTPGNGPVWEHVR